MTEAAKDLLAQALQLTADERVRLAHDLLHSVDDQEDVGEFSAEWIEEIQYRVRRILAGEDGPDEDWRVVLDRIRNRRSERSA